MVDGFGIKKAPYEQGFLFLQQFELCEVRVLFTRVVNGQHGVCLCCSAMGVTTSRALWLGCGRRSASMSQSWFRTARRDLPV